MATALQGTFLIAGMFVLGFLWYFYVGMAQNISSGGRAFFWGTAKSIAVPASELGFLLGLVFAAAQSGRPAWETIRRIGKVSWVFVAVNYAMLLGIY